MKIFLIMILVMVAFSYEDPATCTGFYNYLTHACSACPDNTASTINKGFCNCTGSFYPSASAIGFNHASSCTDLTVILSSILEYTHLKSNNCSL